MDRPMPLAHEMHDATMRLAGVAGRLDAVLGDAPDACDYCDSPATRRAYYGDEDTLVGGGLATVALCRTCTPPSRHPADPHAGYVRMATVGLDREGPIVCGLEVDSVTLAEAERIDSILIVQSLAQRWMVVGELPGPYPDEGSAVEVLLDGQRYDVREDGRGRRIMYAEQMPEAQ